MYKVLIPEREKILKKIADQNPYLINEIKQMEKGLARVGKTVSDEDLALLIDKEDDIVTWLRNKNPEHCPRSSQIMVLRSAGKLMTIRTGRRLGKSYCAAVIIAYELETNPNAKVLVVEPTYGHADTLKEYIWRLGVNPAGAYWLNSHLGGHGFNPTLMVIEEPDYIKEDQFNAAFASMSKKTFVFMTPKKKGQHGIWLEQCADKSFHFPSYCSPWWNQGMEDMFKHEYDKQTYKHEIEAKW